MSDYITVEYAGCKCVVVKGRYSNGRVALTLVDEEDGGPVAVATINVPEIPLRDNEAFIKNYSENAGILNVLKRAGVIRKTGEMYQKDYVTLPIVEVLI